MDHFSGSVKGEKLLYQIWKNKDFDKELETFEGDLVKILDCGEENIDHSGPDFKNARIRIGNLVYVGDIEIDPDISDWKSHGHNIDKNYTKVILHLSLTNKQNQHFVFNKNGRKIPSICLSNFIRKNPESHEIDEEDSLTSERINYLKCHNKNSHIDSKIKTDFIYELGFGRYKKKCDRIYTRLKELAFLRELNSKEPVIRYDLNQRFSEKIFSFIDFQDKEIWHQLFYEFLFEALGYSKNKSPMLKLAQYARIDFLKSVCDSENNHQVIETCLFTIAGLLPSDKEIPNSEISEYSRNLIDYWKSIKEQYDSKILSSTAWHFFKMRPQNFPTIRIAGGSFILYKILFDNFLENIFSKIEKIRSEDVIIKILRTCFVIKAFGYWKSHYIFDKPANNELNYFIGISRADEIIVNVVFPFFSVYAEIFGKQEVSKKILQLYAKYSQKEENSIIRFVTSSLELDEELQQQSIVSQGMIELFRSYCSKNKCLECKIGQSIFN